MARLLGYGLLLISLMAVLGPTRLEAHARLIRSRPGAGEAVTNPPSRVELWFNERLELRFHSITVTEAGGRRMDSGDVQLDPEDPTHIYVTLSSLAPGTYTVRWRILSRDGHTTRGAFTFTVTAGP